MTQFMAASTPEFFVSYRARVHPFLEKPMSTSWERTASSGAKGWAPASAGWAGSSSGSISSPGC